MLKLINAERVRAGLRPVVLGSNAAAQLHAEAALENCFASHWGTDGLKPYMRYSLAGGYQSNAENGSGSSYCIGKSDGYRAIASVEQEIRDAMEGLMDSPGHRDNILDPWHRKINVGLAWDEYNFVAIQHFEGDYVEYDRLPEITDGVLSMSGTTRNGVGLRDGDGLSVQIFYDPPPRALTRGQVSRTYCYDSGLQIAGLRPPLSDDRYYTEDEFTATSQSCPDPYRVPSGAVGPRTLDEAHALWSEAYEASRASPETSITVPWITALEWTLTARDFAVSADIGDLQAEYGGGVYTVTLWGLIDGEDAVISTYSIFFDATAPNAYDIYREDPADGLSKPTATPTVSPSPSPTATPTPSPSPTATSTPSPTATPTATPSPSPTATPIPEPHLRHLGEKRYMLELINAERVRAGLRPVVLGSNAAAQLHAEASLENCFASHWGTDGLKPYMRYSLAGGYQSNAENWSGNSYYCVGESDGYRTIAGAEQAIRNAMESLMDSPGHRDNILDPWHRKINVGLAWNEYNFIVIQHFEGDYVGYHRLPEIANGVLSMSGTTRNGVDLGGDDGLGVQIFYDPPPHALTRGQVSRTYCYGSGLQIAGLRHPPADNRYYLQDDFSTDYRPCPDPYRVPADADGPRSLDEAHAYWREAYEESQVRPGTSITVPWITAIDWTLTDRDFALSADISDLLTGYGSGVYTVTLWGRIEGEDVMISKYSIFYNVSVPDTYGGYAEDTARARPDPTATPTAPQGDDSVSAMIKRVRPAVVRISGGSATGTGVIFDAKGRSGYIVTNHHVVAGRASVTVTVGDASEYDGEVVGVDPVRDLAVIRICCGSFVTLPFGDPSTLDPGSEVVSIGYALGIRGPASVTKGIVSAVRYEPEYLAEVIQSDAPINPGNSGGPMLSLDGRVVGINTYKFYEAGVEGLGFAISADTVVDRIPVLMAGTPIVEARPTALSDPEASWGPASGELRHDPEDGLIETQFAGVSEADMILEATFANPYDADEHPWDYGLMLRAEGGGPRYQVVLTSQRRWSVVWRAGPSEPYEVIAGGTSARMETGAGARNHLMVVAIGERGWVFVNGELMSPVDLGEATHRGDVAVITGSYRDHEMAGASTRFEDFTGRSMSRRYGPADGQLVHGDEGFVSQHWTGVQTRDLIAEAEFVNPAGGEWDYGVALRRSDDAWEVVSVTKGARWYHHSLQDGGGYAVTASGDLSSSRVRASKITRVLVMAIGGSGWLFVDGGLTAVLDLGHNDRRGGVSAVANFWIGHSARVEFSNFTVWAP